MSAVESTQTVPPAATEAQPVVEGPAKKKRTPSAPKEVHPRVQKVIDSLKTKNEKLVQENKKLKNTIHEHKAANSRIRRIPKKSPPPQAAA